MFSGGMTLLFATPPVVTTADARGLLLPCSTDEWTFEVDSGDWTPPSSTLYDDAMMALWSGTPSDCSAFGVRILANSVFLEIWQAKHGHGLWLPEDWKERHYIVLQTLQSHIRQEDVCPMTIRKWLTSRFTATIVTHWSATQTIFSTDAITVSPTTRRISKKLSVIVAKQPYVKL